MDESVAQGRSVFLRSLTRYHILKHLFIGSNVPDALTQLFLYETISLTLHSLDSFPPLLFVFKSSFWEKASLFGRKLESTEWGRKRSTCMLYSRMRREYSVHVVS